MRKIIFLSLFLFLSAFSLSATTSSADGKTKENNTSNTLKPGDINAIFKPLDTCLATNYATTLSEFYKNIQKYFTEESNENLLKIYQKDDLESEALRFFAPYFLRGDTLSGFDKDCWANFKDFIDSLKTADLKKQKEHQETWLSCTQVNYPKKEFKAIKQIQTCFAAGSNKKK